MTKQRFLVTGGAGFIGSNFLNEAVPRRAADEFVNVDVLTYAANLANLASVATLPNYTFVQLDVADGPRIAELIASLEPDVVVHFAAESHVDRSIWGPEAFVRTNVHGTYCLLEACRALNAKKPVLFQHVSTDEVYGSLGDTGRFTEQSPYAPSSPYAATKAASDHLVRAYHRTYGLPVKLTNCSNNYGPYQFPEKLIPLMIRNAVQRQALPVYGTGHNVRDWLHVEDHCRALWTVIERGRIGDTYNVGGGAELRNVDLVRRICTVLAEETGTPETHLLELITFVPDRPGHDVRYAVDASKVERECGWRPRESLETGLRRTVRWYLDNPAWVESVCTGAYRDWLTRNYAQRERHGA
jgi:dTDP-glucose 4,6-dehydratase